jgi:hypothetical protein
MRKHLRLVVFIKDFCANFLRISYLAKPTRRPLAGMTASSVTVRKKIKTLAVSYPGLKSTKLFKKVTSNSCELVTKKQRWCSLAVAMRSKYSYTLFYLCLQCSVAEHRFIHFTDARLIASYQNMMEKSVACAYLLLLEYIDIFKRSYIQ